MVINNVKYDEIDEALNRFYDSEQAEDLYDEVIISDEEHLGDDAIVAMAPAWRVTDKGLIFMEGMYCNRSRITGELEPDWSLTLIYADAADEKFDPYRWVYFEQDAPSVTIHNYLYAVENTGFMPC